ncbi:MAG: phosphoribosyltransferase family protein [Candidatus Glassbacteria bacterium]
MKPKRLLYDTEQIRQAVETLAAAVFKRLGPGTPATFVILLKGGARFAFDLLSRYPAPYYYDFLGVASYGEDTDSQGIVKFYHYALDRETIDGRAVVLLDDICDSGATFRAVVDRIKTDYAPAEILTCSLVWRSGAGFSPDFFAFQLDSNDYLVGYGLGAGEDFRHLNDIYTLDFEEE